MNKNIHILLQHIFKTRALILATHSGSKESKVSIRPLMIKGQLSYQMSEQKEKQIFHRNLSDDQCLSWMIENIDRFKQTFLFTADFDYHLLSGKKGITLLKKPPTKTPQSFSHNRKKHYSINEGDKVPFLITLGIMNPEGKVYPAKQDKFRQINKFLETIEDVLPSLKEKKKLKIVDFGCGKAYLTFALYYYLTHQKNFIVEMIGIDLKADVISDCQKLAASLNFDIQFINASIDDYQSKGTIDMVVSLHACDTATDAALEKAIGWQAQVILSVPCCQHELLSQIEQESLTPLLKHGILKERFSALATDAARGQLLEIAGYHTQIVEFIDMEHTPKNILIRAIKREKPDTALQGQALEDYQAFKALLHIAPSLERRLKRGSYYTASS